MLRDIATYLQGQGLGTLGTDLFISRLQDVDVPAFATGLFARPGMGGTRVMDIAGLTTERPELQVIVRGATNQYALAETRAHAIHNALAQLTNVVLSGTRYLACDALSAPEDLGPDPHNRPMLGARYIVEREPV